MDGFFQALELFEVHVAEAKIKNDRMDAQVLADLVRAGLIAESYVPSQELREQRALLRQRRSLVEDTVAVKNRIHNLLDKYDLKPEYTDLFGKKGLEWLRSLQLSSIDRTILDIIRVLYGLASVTLNPDSWLSVS